MMMRSYRELKLVASALFICVLLATAPRAGFSQEGSGDQSGLPVSAGFSITNEGISIIPAFGLGEPAVLTNLSVGNRFRFEPEFYFSAKGDPWAFLLWMRYDLIRHERFSLGIGAHPGYTFLKSGGNGTDSVTEVIKILAGELTMRYRLGDDLDIGLYYLRGGALDGASPRESHFLSLNSRLPSLHLSRGVRFTLLPQLYYLKLDETDGFYAATTAILGVDGLPVTLSSVINKIIESNITGNPDPLWNISLNYTVQF